MKLAEYPHVLPPFSHQDDHLRNNAHKRAWGLLWEQGTAKTKPVIDTMCLLYANDRADGLVVVAPPGVERNWETDEISAHMPPEFKEQTRIEVFRTKKKGTKAHKAKMNEICYHKGLAVLLISYNAYMTDAGKEAVKKFLLKRRAMMVLDEAHNIKSPGAKRTLSLCRVAPLAQYRRILTGTPVAQGPFDIYSQIRFLDQNFWKDRGIGGAVEFRQYFGEWLTRADVQARLGYDPGYDKLIRYKNVEQLKEWLSEISDRYLKDEVLDLPPKLYSKRYVEMSNLQRDLYEQMMEELWVEIRSGEIIEGQLPIVKLLRLQQILCNYLPTEDDEEPTVRLEGTNPRLKAMEQIRDETHHPCLVWARFRDDVNQLMDLLGDEAVRYDGAVDEDEAERNKQAFQAGDAKWFVGTAAKGGPGLTLNQAKTVIYYSNSFKLIDRLQSEDRAHRAGMDEHPVNYIDLAVPDTIDEKIIFNLRDKVDIASQVTGDNLKEWI